MVRRLHLQGAFGVFLASLAIAALGGVAPSAAAASTTSGESQATCTPSPCLPADKTVSYTLTGVENGDGTTSTREYAVNRPLHLIPDLSNRAPAVLVFYPGGNCGLAPSGRFASFAPQDRFVVVYMEVPCGRDNNWDKRNVNPETSTAVNDEPYVAAVVEAIVQCPETAAAPNQCVDPQRIYAAGASSGGNMAADIMCDIENSKLFRGYLIDSSSLQLFEGAPSCPSANSGFFVMMALSNYSIDSLLYYDEDKNPHLDVPAFADWAAARLGCTSERVDDAIGQPVASTLRYTYSGPCAQAAAGAPAVVTLGVQDGGHTWACQDSDEGAKPHECPDEGFDPPPLTACGLPNTNGLFVERAFWEFAAIGVPPETATAPSCSPSGGGSGSESENPLLTSTVGGALGSSSPPTGQPPAGPLPVVGQPPAGRPFVALGDGYASGEGNPPYLPATDTARDRCRRSTSSYPLIGSGLLSGGASGLNLRACNGAKIADFYGSNRRDHEPPQLQWVDAATRLVSVSVGWDDALLPKLLHSCVRNGSRCQRPWRVRAESAIRAIGSRSPRSRDSLYALYEKIASLAPHARVVVFGYPRLFPNAPPATCRAGAHGLSFTRRSMEWIDSVIRKLDDAIASAAAGADVRYVTASYNAFDGHELCTRRPDASGSLTASRTSPRDILDSSFTPNRRGQEALARLLEAAATATG